MAGRRGAPPQLAGSSLHLNVFRMLTTEVALTAIIVMVVHIVVVMVMVIRSDTY